MLASVCMCFGVTLCHMLLLMFVCLFIEGLWPCQTHRVSSGLSAVDSCVSFSTDCVTRGFVQDHHIAANLPQGRGSQTQHQCRSGIQVIIYICISLPFCGTYAACKHRHMSSSLLLCWHKHFTRIRPNCFLSLSEVSRRRVPFTNQIDFGHGSYRLLGTSFSGPDGCILFRIDCIKNNTNQKHGHLSRNIYLKKNDPSDASDA